MASILLVFFAVAILTAVAIVLWRSGQPIRLLASSAVQGLCALAAVNAAGMFTGVSVGFNWLSGLSCTVLGIPGVVCLLLLGVLFGA